MNVFVDTSALYATLDTSDPNYPAAVRVWRDLAQQRAQAVCTNYIMLETIALAQRRLGIGALRLLQEDIDPILHIHWLGAEEHRAAVQALLIANRRQLSLVDCTSFDVMRRLGIKQAFSFDKHFAEQGFECLPGV